jgi:hypothetical protein
MRTIARSVSLVAALCVLGAPTLASAEVKQTGQTKQGWIYDFDDDPLAAGVGGPHGEGIRVRKNAARVLLIRPRTSFVPELFKSVANL